MNDRRDAAQPADLPLPKKLIYGAVVTAAFLLLLEGVLALAGFAPVLEDEDPFVGFADTVPLFVEAVGEDGGAVWRTAPNKRLFNRQEFPRTKAPGTVRIFCLGGSTTFGRPYDDTGSFAAWLRELLPAVAPDLRFEVINAGGVSYASYRVARLMGELAELDPDLFVVYSGQNEFLEERTYRDLRRLPPVLRAVSGVLARTRTWAATAAAADALGLRGGDAAGGGKPTLAGEADTRLERFGPGVYERDDALRARILEHYRVSLERMAAIAARADAGLVCVTPASNLKDCSPFKSESTPGLDPAAAAGTAARLAQARGHLDAGRPGEALALLDEALAADPRHAGLHYRRGRALLALDRGDEARAAFVRAVEEDVCPLRALPAMQEAVAAVAADAGAGHVDFARLLADDARRTLGHPAPGNEHFLDHVHPTVAANGQLAAALVPEILAQLGREANAPGAEAVAAASARITSRLDPALQARSLANLAKVTAWSGKLEDAVRPARQALAFDVGDPLTTASAAGILATWHARQGDDERERHYFGLALDATPDDSDLRFRLALRALDRDPPEVERAAAQLLRAAVFWQGERREVPHRMLGGILAERGASAAGLSHLLEARAIAPRDPDTAALLERVAARLGPAAAAVATPRFTVDRHPSGRIARIVQVTVDERGHATADGVWTEWHENGRAARYAEMAGGRVAGADVRWDPEGRRLGAPAAR